MNANDSLIVFGRKLTELDVKTTFEFDQAHASSEEKDLLIRVSAEVTAPRDSNLLNALVLFCDVSDVFFHDPGIFDTVDISNDWSLDNLFNVVYHGLLGALLDLYCPLLDNRCGVSSTNRLLSGESATVSLYITSVRHNNSVLEFNFWDLDYRLYNAILIFNNRYFYCLFDYAILVLDGWNFHLPLNDAVLKLNDRNFDCFFNDSVLVLNLRHFDSLGDNLISVLYDGDFDLDFDYSVLILNARNFNNFLNDPVSVFNDGDLNSLNDYTILVLNCGNLYFIYHYALFILDVHYFFSF